MKLGKIIKTCFFIFSFIFFLFKLATPCFGEIKSYVTVVNPVRGEYAWGIKPGSPLSGVILQRKWLDQSGLPATWLLRYDAVASTSISSYFKDPALTKDSELGLFLEFIPEVAREAKVSYPNDGVFWHDANKIFLSGYKPEEREKLIDATFRKFKETFGFFPKSVGAWHIDAFSAGYMKGKYGVTGVLICADQFGTDGYQIWGGYWGVPFYPSKYNILMPAQTIKNRLDLVVFWWAARDPELGYGGSAGGSTYSVQVNDYLQQNFGIDYFNRLLDIYLKNPKNDFGQITIGLENDNDWITIGDGFMKQLNEIKRRKDIGEISVTTMNKFSDWYRGHYKISPEHEIGTWIMSPDFRVWLLEKDGQTYIRDLRIYNENWPEANLVSANPWGTLSLNNPYKVDNIRFNSQVLAPQ